MSDLGINLLQWKPEALLSSTWVIIREGVNPTEESMAKSCRGPSIAGYNAVPCTDDSHNVGMADPAEVSFQLLRVV